MKKLKDRYPYLLRYLEVRYVVSCPQYGEVCILVITLKYLPYYKYELELKLMHLTEFKDIPKPSRSICSI